MSRNKFTLRIVVVSAFVTTGCKPPPPPTATPEPRKPNEQPAIDADIERAEKQISGLEAIESRLNNERDQARVELIKRLAKIAADGSSAEAACETDPLARRLLGDLLDVDRRMQEMQEELVRARRDVVGTIAAKHGVPVDVAERPRIELTERRGAILSKLPGLVSNEQVALQAKQEAEATFSSLTSCEEERVKLAGQLAAKERDARTHATNVHDLEEAYKLTAARWMALVYAKALDRSWRGDDGVPDALRIVRVGESAIVGKAGQLTVVSVAADKKSVVVRCSGAASDWTYAVGEEQTIYIGSPVVNVRVLAADLPGNFVAISVFDTPPPDSLVAETLRIYFTEPTKQEKRPGPSTILKFPPKRQVLQRSP